MKKLAKCLSVLFKVWGVVSLVAAVGLAGYLTHLFFFDHPKPRGAQTDFADSAYVQRVLELGHIDDDASYVIQDSFRAEASFIGERCETLAIQLESFPEELLEVDPFAESPIWRAGPQTNSIILRAIDAAWDNLTSYGVTWFPSADQLNSARYYLCICRMTIQADSISEVRLLAYDRERQMLFYAGSYG